MDRSEILAKNVSDMILDYYTVLFSSSILVDSHSEYLCLTGCG